MSNSLRVTVWNEYRHEQHSDHPASRVYPHGIHEAIAAYLREQPGLAVRTATLDAPDQGLPAQVLDNTDVLIWWGHAAHDAVADALVDRIQARVLAGMGLVVLHSGHFSKIFKRLMGTSCNLQWREGNDHERLWVLEPGHPIAAGLPPYIELAHEEMYGERFDIPAPETLVLVSWFSGGEVFRSGCCYTRGLGKIFYFRPGHESFPTYYDPLVRQVIGNAVRWAAPAGGTPPVFGNVPPREQQ
ncbi:MAG TPA: ThuA domain-containing protein [Chloroflexia bacterium]|nr:ThuA domain-containing protein [Chloroflexia bacterium]